MNRVKPEPRVNLSKLRDIGWRLWDPIGLLGESEANPLRWDAPENRGFADEYDHYLIAAASGLRKGQPSERVVDFLVYAETEYMGLGKSETTIWRAKAVVSAILADPSIWIMPDDQGRFP